MAKIIEQHAIVKFSKISKDSDSSTTVVDPEVLQSLEQVIQEIVGDSIVVELSIE
jgi:hypothetical protein